MTIQNDKFEEENLIELNITIGDMEQKRDEDTESFFYRLLSDDFIFRRANRSLVKKDSTLVQNITEGGFLGSLKLASPFISRKSEDIDVKFMDGRALVTLVVSTLSADGKEGLYRNIRLFSKHENDWQLQFWYNYEITDG